MKRVALAAGLLAVTAVAGCSQGRPSPTPSPTFTSAPSPTGTATDLPTASATPAVSPSTSPAPTSAASAAGPQPCLTSQLRLSVGPSNGGAGTNHQPLRLTNVGTACTLYGYPGVSFLDGSGRQLGSPATESGVPAHQVPVAAGATVHAELAYANAGAFPQASCRPAQAARVRVYPPGQRDALTAPDQVLVCSAPNAGQLHIDPVAAGAG